MFYNETIISLFRDPQHSGEFPATCATVFTAQAGHSGQSDLLRLQVKISADTITDAKFKVQGGITTIAAAEFLARTIIGVKITELATINSQTIIDALQLPTRRIYSALLADDALEKIKQEIKHGR